MVSCLNIVKAVKRNRIVNAGIVSVERYYILNAHCHKLLQRHCAVHGFAGGSSVLSAFIKHRHYNGYSSRLAAERRYYALQILVMVIGAHGDGLTVHFIGYAVIKAVADDVCVKSSGGVL